MDMSDLTISRPSGPANPVPLGSRTGSKSDAPLVRSHLPVVRRTIVAVGLHLPIPIFPSVVAELRRIQIRIKRAGRDVAEDVEHVPAADGEIRGEQAVLFRKPLVIARVKPPWGTEWLWPSPINPPKLITAYATRPETLSMII